MHCLDGAEAGHRLIQHERDARTDSTHQNWEFVDGIVSPAVRGEQQLALVMRGTIGDEESGLYLEPVDRNDTAQLWTLSPAPGNRTRSIGHSGATKAVARSLFGAKEHPARGNGEGSQDSRM